MHGRGELAARLAVEWPMHVEVVFLLGAGFARAISADMPLLQDLGDRVVRALEDRTAIPEQVRAMMRENFAHALSYLEQEKPWITEADNLRHRALFLDISNAIARDLERTVARVTQTPAAEAPPWVARLLRHWHEHRCTVVTLNYDTLVETIAAGCALPDGGRIRAADLYPPVLTDAAARSSGPLDPQRRQPTFRLLKLHGSTNWYYSGRRSAYGEPIFFVPPLAGGHADDRERQAHELRLRAVADKYPFLVPPIYDKSPLLTHETIRALWFEAGEALKRARRIICLGYSLPESDLTMMHFLRATRGAGARIELVNQSRDALKNFRRLFGEEGAAIEQCVVGDNCIAEFVEREGA